MFKLDLYLQSLSASDDSSVMWKATLKWNTSSKTKKEIFCELRILVLFVYIVMFSTNQKMPPLILKNREVTFFLTKVVSRFFDYYCIPEKKTTSFTMQKIQSFLPFEINWKYHLMKLIRKLGEKSYLSCSQTPARTLICIKSLPEKSCLRMKRAKSIEEELKDMSHSHNLNQGKYFTCKTPERCLSIHYFS